MNKFSLLVLSILIGLLLAAAAPSPAPSRLDSGLPDAANTPFAPGVVLAGLKAGASLQAGSPGLNKLLPGLEVQAMEPVFPAGFGSLKAADAGGLNSLAHIYRLRLPANSDVLTAVAALQANPEVAFAEPDYLAHSLAVPTDPLFAQQWGLARINAPAAWNTTTGSPEVVVALVDAGLDTTHPDLAGQLWINPGEIPANGIDDDYNGKTDDINGWNIIGSNADLGDNTGHGSQVAGVIAATANNGQGIAGLCWQCRLMVVKVMQPGGLANYSDIAAGIAYAAQKGADVINLSLGGSADSATLRAAIAAAAETAVIVGGAGNDNSSAPFYPAAYDQHVLAVAGTDSGDVKVTTSNFGPWVDVTAPGQDITTTLSGGGYGPASGTSVAAPFAAGLAGLLLGQHPDWSPDQVRAHIIQTAANIDAANPAYAGQLGAGRIEAGQATLSLPHPLLRPGDYTSDGQVNGAIKTGTPVALTVSLHNDWGDAENVTATLSTTDPVVAVTQAAAAYGEIKALESVSNVSQPFQVLAAAGNYNRVIPFSLQVVADGIVSTQTFTATTEPQTVNVSGSINTDTLWTKNRIYHVTGSLVIYPGVTLTIQPGTQVKFDGEKMLVVRGTLIAAGTADEPIQFTAWTRPDYTLCPSEINLCPGEWGGSYLGSSQAGILFTDDSPPAQFDGSGNYLNGSVIRYAVFEHSFGGILVHGFAAPFLDHNLIRHNRGTALVGMGLRNPLLITHNRIIDNETSSYFVINLWSGEARLRQNLIADNRGAIQLYGSHQVISNTITGNIGTNYGDGHEGILHLAGGGSPEVPFIRGNNLYANQAPNEVMMGVGPNYIADVDAPQNYWGTTDSAAIRSRIYDSAQYLGTGTFTFSPVLAAPDPGAPAILYQLTLDPPSPVGIQPVSFNLTFSRPMDPAVEPVVTFGATKPYTTYRVTNGAWTGDTTWQATYEMTSLVPVGAYTISVSQARDADEGFTIPTDTRFGFSVDYAGQITDRTPPPAPTVLAGGRTGDPSTVEGLWFAGDPESPITAYRYAIGSTPGAVDIINWNTTTAATLTKSGLGLVDGRQYWLSVQAQNVGGLWSASGYGGFVAGQPMGRVFLPTVIK